jgi:hypothetical protein
MNKRNYRRRNRARQEGIVLTPRGEPLFARDFKRYADLGAIDDRSVVEREMDRAYQSAANDAEDSDMATAPTNDPTAHS